METISLKVSRETSKKILEAVKAFDYGTKTEFIREAVRDKLSALEKKRAIDALLKMKGSLKGKNPFKSYEEWHNWRSNEGSEELMKALEKELSAKKN